MATSILVPVDLSPASARAWNHASQVAKGMGLPLVLLYVLDPPSDAELRAARFLGDDGMDLLAEEAHVELEAAEKILRAWAEPVLEEGTSVRCVARSGDPARVILEAVRDFEPFAVVLGRHGRNPVKKLLVGSVSDAVATKSPAPVTLVP